MPRGTVYNTCTLQMSTEHACVLLGALAILNRRETQSWISGVFPCPILCQAELKPKFFFPFKKRRNGRAKLIIGMDDGSVPVQDLGGYAMLSGRVSLRSAGLQPSIATVFSFHIAPAPASSHQSGNSVFLSHHSNSSIQLQPAERIMCT